MRAIIVRKFGGPEVLQLSHDAPVPTVEPKQVLVKVLSAGVNPVDTYIRQGTYAALPQLPYTPGKDAAGIVHKIGSQVTRLKEGDRVYTSFHAKSGTYAEYSLFDEQGVQPLPERLSFSQGAAVGVPYYTAYRALIIKAKAQASETILVHGGSGAVGIAAIQMAKAYGMKVIATAGTEEGLQLVRDMGAHHAFSHRKEGYMADILKATEGNGVDVILEMLANVNLGNDLTILKQQGRVIVIGSRGDVNITPRLIMMKETTVSGVALGQTTKDEWDASVAAITEGINKGWVNPVVGKEYSLEDAKQAHRDVIDGPGTKGKLVINI